MINTTIAYKRAIEKNRQFRLLDKIILNDGKELQLSMEDVTAYSINEATSANGKFEIGAAIVKEYKASLNNMDGNLDGIGFEGADISAKIGLRLLDGSWEDLRKGEFRIVEAKEKDLTIDIKAYDGMLFFDRPYSESKLSYPASINQIISDACLSCQMMFNARTVQMGNYIVKNRPDDKAVTFRDIISYCAQIMGCYAYINNLGQLEFGWYDFNELKFLRDGRYDGGMFDKSTPYASGDILDGGGFAPWSAGDVLDGGEFTDMESYHHVYLLKSKSVNTNDITITGVSISFKKDDDQEEVLMYGEEGYVLELSENPLIQDDAQQILQHVGQKVTGNTFRPLSITTQSDPSMEAGDLVIVTDRKQRSYWTVITNTTFSLSGSQKIECSAETPTEKNYTRYGAVTKLVSAAKENSERKLSSYENTSRQFSELMARSMGLYTTYEEQEDGSTIKYQHDKPQLSESKTIWKQSQNAFGVSTDGGKTWNAGTDAEGNALYNVLSTVGFYFDWAQGGTLTLGGENNQDGIQIVKDKDGNEIGRWGNLGIVMKKGDIAGPSITIGGKDSDGVLKILDNTGKTITNWSNLDTFMTIGNRESGYEYAPYSFSCGISCVASGKNSISIGPYTKSIYRNQISIGYYSDPGSPDPNDISKSLEEQRAKWPVVIGAGTNNNSRANALVIDHSGNTCVSGLAFMNRLYKIHDGDEIIGKIRYAGNGIDVSYGTNSISLGNGKFIGISAYNAAGNDDAMDLGSSNNPWNKIWAAYTTIQSSDRRLKKNFSPLTIEYVKDFFMALKPTRYQFISNQNGRSHWGLISQEVEDALKIGEIDTKDFSGFIIDKDENGDDRYFLSYEEFIAPIITMVQYLTEKNENQDKKINDLTKRLEKLEALLLKGDD